VPETQKPAIKEGGTVRRSQGVKLVVKNSEFLTASLKLLERLLRRWVARIDARSGENLEHVRQDLAVLQRAKVKMCESDPFDSARPANEGVLLLAVVENHLPFLIQ